MNFSYPAQQPSSTGSVKDTISSAKQHFVRSAKDSGQKYLVLPDGLREAAFRLHHDIPTAGHQGIKRTNFRIKESFYWYGLSGDVERYFAACEICN